MKKLKRNATSLYLNITFKLIFLTIIVQKTLRTKTCGHIQRIIAS